MTRRDFLKGLVAAAAYVSIPARTLFEIAEAAEQQGYDILWVSPQEYNDYSTGLSPELRFQIAALPHEHMLFRGNPVMPHQTKRTPKTDERWERFNALLRENIK